MPARPDYFDPALWLHHPDLGPNAELGRLRNTERASPAPFHDDRFVRWHDEDNPALSLAGQRPPTDGRLGHIAIGKIAGVFSGHAHATNDRPTWGEVLFTGVHGGGLLASGVAFMAAPHTVKYTGQGRLTAHGYPQQNGLSAIAPEEVSKGGLEFEKHGDWYFCTNGQQRVVFARFALWHLHHSLDTPLTNVWIRGA